jgi:uncharacterized membrane protein YkvA (DUF1232 family)
MTTKLPSARPTTLPRSSRPEHVMSVDRIGRLKSWAHRLKRDAVMLWLAARDPRVPWPAKALCAAMAAYALSPIDLIPDFIPVLGYLDELILLPLAVALAVRLIPADLISELRADAERVVNRPVSLAGALAIGCVWAAVAAALFWHLSRSG